MKTINNILHFIFYCLFRGHQIENYLAENETWILTKRCKHCKIGFGLPHWKLHNYPPPNSSPEEVLIWEKYCDELMDGVRKEVLKD